MQAPACAAWCAGALRGARHHSRMRRGCVEFCKIFAGRIGEAQHHLAAVLAEFIFLGQQLQHASFRLRRIENKIPLTDEDRARESSHLPLQLDFRRGKKTGSLEALPGAGCHYLLARPSLHAVAGLAQLQRIFLALETHCGEGRASVAVLLQNRGVVARSFLQIDDLRGYFG